MLFKKDKINFQKYFPCKYFVADTIATKRQNIFNDDQTSIYETTSMKGNIIVISRLINW